MSTGLRRAREPTTVRWLAPVGTACVRCLRWAPCASGAGFPRTARLDPPAASGRQTAFLRRAHRRH